MNTNRNIINTIMEGATNYTTMCNDIANRNNIVTTRTLHTVTTRRNKCKCAVCRRDVAPNEGVRIVTPSHPRGLTLCDIHGSIHNMEGYNTENHNHIGTRTVKGITTSLEVETEHNTVTSKAVMHCDLGFCCTSDGSLGYDGIEYKSPIFDSLQACTKTLGTIEYLNKEGFFNTNTGNTSAHIHTGFYDDVVDFRHIYGCVDDYFQFFGCLYEYLEKMPNAKMKEYFGRGFVNYSRTIRPDGNGGYILPKHDGNGKRIRYDDKKLKGSDDLFGTGSWNCTQHYLTFNLQHSYSIEFRLPVFINARQYRNCILAMQDLLAVLRDNDFTPLEPQKTLVDVFRKHFPY